MSDTEDKYMVASLMDVLIVIHDYAVWAENDLSQSKLDNSQETGEKKFKLWKIEKKTTKINRGEFILFIIIV